MSDTFDPGDTWTMAQFDGEVPTGVVAYRESDGSWTYWIRKALAFHLPATPYTVIRVTWRDDVWEGQRNVNPVLIRQPANAGVDWAWSDAGDSFGSSDNLARRIDSFEVLAEPRVATMEHVLAEAGGLISTDGHRHLRRELKLPEYPVNET